MPADQPRRIFCMSRLLACLCAAALAGHALAQEGAPGKDAKPQSPPATTPKPAPAEDTLVYVKMSTDAGDIVLELNQTKAPITVKNFLAYVDRDFYKGTIFHRVIADFMIQGGGMTKDGTQKKTDAPIKNEWRNGLSNVKYSIAMARLGNDVDSATSQFFINTDDNNGKKKFNLDKPQPDGAAYCVFGKVVDGFATVEKIRAAPVERDVRGENSKPINPVVINAVKRLTDAEVAAWKEKAKKPASPADTKDGK